MILLVQSVNNHSPGLDWCPLPALVVTRYQKHQTEHRDPFDAHQLAVIMFGLSCPHQEGGYILQRAISQQKCNFVIIICLRSAQMAKHAAGRGIYTTRNLL